MGHEESHLIRRRKILAAHPEIQLLYGKDLAGAWGAIALNTVQLLALIVFPQ